MRISKYLLAGLAAAALVACGGGGGGDSTTLVAADAQPVTVNTQTGSAAAQALSGQALSFANGVSTFGTTGTATNLTITGGSAPTFNVAAGGNTASGNLTFGSCIFTVTASTFASTHALGLGKTATVSNCSIDFSTANKVATGSAVTVQVTLSLDGAISSPVNTTIAIESDGDILVNGVKITTVSVTQVTGGS
ncbi:hypothetical protein EZ313_17970 [Ramlibacter henchirensis]|uniref:DUF5666 domain-containing protein n=1 Tax=Ramlibacter henchirensis TaxID=204072 RepID=A0A4Z0BXQ7_9BURK|nr:hypothetical protein [Ramlibacter henchirensis]TFZ03100.1 hypothetical protein EZ313_17970 [Ramlibacter henchirensis]